MTKTKHPARFGSEVRNMIVMRRAFTLIELLVVIAIIAVLAGILFPVFARAKAAAKKTTCLSNLKQIGMTMSLYMTDNDGLFPHALDASDKYSSNIWGNNADWYQRIKSMPMMHEALQPYVKSLEVFHCPSDSGTRVLDNHFPDQLISSPSLFKAYGNSYFYRTEIGFRYKSETGIDKIAEVNVMFDAGGHWHGDGKMLELSDGANLFNTLRGYRYNVLFGDFHAKNLDYFTYQTAWAQPIQ